MRKIWMDIQRGENIDLYITVAVAIPLAILAIIGLAPPSLVSSITLAILALIAISLLTNRNRMETVGNQRKLWSAGIVDAYESLAQTDIKQRLASARRYIRFLGTMMEDNIIFEDAFVSAAKNGCKIQILLIDPKSEIAAKRSLQLGLHKDLVKIKTLTRIKELKALSAKHHIDIEMRVYDSAMPALYACLCDEYALIGFYWRQDRVTESPLLEVQGVHTTPFGQLIEKEFLTIWESAKVVDAFG